VKWSILDGLLERSTLGGLDKINKNVIKNEAIPNSLTYINIHYSTPISSSLTYINIHYSTLIPALWTKIKYYVYHYYHYWLSLDNWWYYKNQH